MTWITRDESYKSITSTKKPPTWGQLFLEGNLNEQVDQDTCMTQITKDESH